MTAVVASPAAPPVGPEWETVSARRGLSDLSAAALVKFGGGGVAARTRGGVGGGVVRNGGAPVAIARTSARITKVPDGSTGSAVHENHSRTHSALAAGHSVEVVGLKGEN